METENDDMFKGGRYIPTCILSCPRYESPEISQNWDIDCQIQTTPIWSLLSWSKHRFSLCSASYQGCVRQGLEKEAMFWAMEMMKSANDINGISALLPGGKIQMRRIGMGETNFWTRSLVICAEDISLANPWMIVAIWQIYQTPRYTYEEAELAACRVAIILSNSLKCRVADWACGARIPTGQPFNLRNHYDQLCISMANGKHLEAIAYSGEIIGQCESLSLDKGMFSGLVGDTKIHGKAVKWYKNIRQLIWLAILRVVNHINQRGEFNALKKIVETCYDVAHEDKFRWKGSAHLFGRMAILLICFSDTWKNAPVQINLEFFPDLKQYTNKEVKSLMLSHRNRDFTYKMSNVCMDKHTGEGKSLNRGLQHFIEIKQFLVFHDPKWIQLSNYYLAICFQTRYVKDRLFDRSRLSPLEYKDRVLPLIIQSHHEMDLFCRMMMTRTCTITMGDAATYFDGMKTQGTQLESGLTIEDMVHLCHTFSQHTKCEFYDLKSIANIENQKKCMEYPIIERNAAILVIRQGAAICGNTSSDNAFRELIAKGISWDTKHLSRGKVVEKRQRYNLVFGPKANEPDYENGKGRTISFDQVPIMKRMMDNLANVHPKFKGLYAEGNLYLPNGDIGYHGDKERRVVVAFRYGKSMDLSYVWYNKSKPISMPIMITLNHGDMYIMSDSAVGYDWMSSSKVTLRHSAFYNDLITYKPKVDPANKQEDLTQTNAKNQLVVMCGYPASGKTTKANQALKHLCNPVIISGDELKTENKILKATNQALIEGKSPIVDAANLTVDKRAVFIEMAARFGVQCVCIFCSASMEESMRRAKHRHDQGGVKIPRVAYYTMRKKYTPPSQLERFANIYTYN